MRFTDVKLEEIVVDEKDKNGIWSFSFDVPATDELVDVSNRIRKEHGNDDLVCVELDNDVFYTFYLMYDSTVRMFVEPYNSEKDEFVFYNIPLTDEEKVMLLAKAITVLVDEC